MIVFFMVIVFYHPGLEIIILHIRMIVSLEERTLDQGSRTKYSTVLDLGPCFGMNGHFRQDPDVISRLPESTIDFLSVCIGFRSLSRVKIVVLNENQGFIYIFIEKCVLFISFLFQGSF